MKWPFGRRIDPAHAWGVVAVGTAGLVAIPTILATLHATDVRFRWWWPTGWMAVPAAIFLVGAGLIVLSAGRPEQAAQSGADTGGGPPGVRTPSEPSGPSGPSGPKLSTEAVRVGGASAQVAAGHVFISAAPEDAADADQLQQDLESAGVVVWRDVTDLTPGDDQPLAIRRAITDGAVVFLACFSSSGTAQAKSLQNVELWLAADQVRLRRPGVPWLIPVRFDDCRVPDIDLGGGRTLASLTRADLFGVQRDKEFARLLTAIRRVVG